jgi:hypothetical protein
MAAGANNTFRQVGIATGIAALGAILQSKAGAGTRSPGAYIDGLNEILLVGAFVLFAGAVLGALLVRTKDLVASGPQAQAAHGAD